MKPRMLAVLTLALFALVVLRATPTHASSPLVQWSTGVANSVFSFWSNATGTGSCNPSACLDTVSFRLQKPALVNTAIFTLKLVGSLGCKIDYAIWPSSIQDMSNGVAVTTSGAAAIVPVTPSGPLVVSSTDLACSSLTGSFASYPLSLPPTRLAAGVVYQLGLYVKSNSTNFVIGTQGVQESFTTGVGNGLNYPGTEGTCGLSSCITSGNNDIPFFEIDGDPVSQGGYVGCDPYCSTSSTTANSAPWWISWPGVLLPAGILAGAGTLAFSTRRRTRH